MVDYKAQAKLIRKQLESLGYEVKKSPYGLGWIVKNFPYGIDEKIEREEYDFRVEELDKWDDCDPIDEIIDWR